MQTGTVTRPRTLVGWAALGSLGALVAVLGGATVGSVPRPASYHWWIWMPGGGYALAHLLYFAGLGALAVAWWKVRPRPTHPLSSGATWALLGAWATPLALGAPLASRDIYSYAAEGQLARAGLNPYHVGPIALSPGPLVDSIADVWRATPSPYGPLFVAETHLASALAGSSLIAQVLAQRLLAVAALVAIAALVGPLCASLGTDAATGRWLVVLSPLALLSAASQAHNDTAMLGLLLGGLLSWRREHRVLAVLLISLAATVKLPALVALPFLFAPLVRAARGRRRLTLLLEATLLPAAVGTAVSLATGLGFAWISPSALKIPTQLRVAITPVVALGSLLGTLARALGLHGTTHGVVTVLQDLFALAAAALMLRALYRTGERNALTRLGLALSALVALSPTFWPWYALWPLSVLAVTSAQRLRVLGLVAAGAMFLVGPGGTPLIGGVGADLAGAAVAAGLVLLWRHRVIPAWLEAVDGAH